MLPEDRLVIKALSADDSIHYAEELCRLDGLCNRPAWTANQFSEELTIDYSQILAVFDESADIQTKNIPQAFIVIHKIIDELSIANFGVHPDYRRRGIAAKLLTEVLTDAAKEKLIAATLEVRESNIPAINLYKRFGFVEVGRRPGYYSDDRETAIIMTLNF